MVEKQNKHPALPSLSWMYKSSKPNFFPKKLDLSLSKRDFERKITSALTRPLRSRSSQIAMVEYHDHSYHGFHCSRRYPLREPSDS